MRYSYDENMVHRTQNLMASMIDFSVNGLKNDIEEFYGCFLMSEYSGKIENGDSKTIMGMSGIELAMRVLSIDDLHHSAIDEYNQFSMCRSPEYWTGWALAYFQWESTLSYKEINNTRNISIIRGMYNPYHEMDISRFCDDMREIYKASNKVSRLKFMRINAGMSQKTLSDITGIPIKTIQQYEQKQKNINHARADYLVSFSKALNCDIELLIEKI